MSRKTRRNRGEATGISRRAALALIGAGGVMSIGAVGAFDSVTAQRPFGLTVRSDDEALLGIELADQGLESGSTTTLLTLTNGFANALDDIWITVVSAGGLAVDIATQPSGSLAPGAQRPIDATISCQGTHTATVVLDIVAEGATERIEARRAVEISCTTTGPIDPCSLSSTGAELSYPHNLGDYVGTVAGEYTVSLAGSDTVDGDIDVTGAVDIRGGASVSGGITAGGPVEIRGGTSVGGQIVTGDTLTITNGGTLAWPPAPVAVCGDLLLGGGPDLEVTGVTVGGLLSNTALAGQGRGITTTESGISVGDDLVVRGGAVFESVDGITVDGSVDWDGTTLRTTAGDLEVGGDLAVGNGSTLEIAGDLLAGGRFDIGNGADVSVDGDLTVAGDLTLGGGGTLSVGGTTTVDGDSPFN